MTFRPGVVGACGALPIALVAACGSTGDQAANDGGAFVLAVTDDTQNLDPHGPASSVGLVIQMSRLLYDPLVNVAADGAVLPGIAQTWTGSGSAVTFTLREDVTCDDGTPMTAAIVKDNLDYVLDPANESAVRGIRVPVDAVVSADDAAHTLTVSTSTPPEFLLAQLSSLGIVCPGGLADRATLVRGADGTGPYTMSAAVPGSEYRLTRRDRYTWGPDGEPGGPLPESLVVRIVENESTTANLLLDGEVDAAEIRGPDRERLSAAGLTPIAFREPVGQVWFNQRAGRLFEDQALRTAVLQSMDLDEAAQVATRGTGVTSQGLLSEPLVCGGVDPSAALPGHDPAAAEAGLAGRPLAVTLMYPTSLGSDVKAAIELVAAGLGDAGIATTLKPVTDAQLGPTLFETGDWDIFWGKTDVQIPTQLLPYVSGAEPPDGSNFAGVDNATMDAFAESMGSGDTCAAWNEAELALYDAASVVPLADVEVPIFANGASFEVIGTQGGLIVPTSIRVE